MLSISPSNTKLGNIPNVSLPPAVTCPGATDECLDACYVGGKKGYFKMYPSVRIAYRRNLEASKGNWTGDVIRYLAKHSPKYFRIHVSGDFYSAKYIRDWAQIIAAFPGTRFLAFTRSWRVKRLQKALSALATLPNLQLIASIDRSTESQVPAMRLASMGNPGAGKFTMCPGYGPKELQCDACGLCFRDVNVNIWFPIH